MQVNSLDDHKKIIITPHAYLKSEYIVTMVSRQREMDHYSLLRLLRVGCTKELLSKLTLAKEMLSAIIEIKEASV